MAHRSLATFSLAGYSISSWRCYHRAKAMWWGLNDFRSRGTTSAKAKWFCWNFIVPLLYIDNVRWYCYGYITTASSQGEKRRRKLKPCHYVSSRGEKRHRKWICCHWESSQWWEMPWMTSQFDFDNAFTVMGWSPFFLKKSKFIFSFAFVVTW